MLNSLLISTSSCPIALHGATLPVPVATAYRPSLSFSRSSHWPFCYSLIPDRHFPNIGKILLGSACLAVQHHDAVQIACWVEFKSYFDKVTCLSEFQFALVSRQKYRLLKLWCQNVKSIYIYTYLISRILLVNNYFL